MAGIFKAYDVRGLVPQQLDEEIARKIGLAFQFVLDEEDRANGNIRRSRNRFWAPNGNEGGASDKASAYETL